MRKLKNGNLPKETKSLKQNYDLTSSSVKHPVLQASKVPATCNEIEKENIELKKTRALESLKEKAAKERLLKVLLKLNHFEQGTLVYSGNTYRSSCVHDPLFDTAADARELMGFEIERILTALDCKFSSILLEQSSPRDKNRLGDPDSLRNKKENMSPANTDPVSVIRLCARSAVSEETPSFESSLNLIHSASQVIREKSSFETEARRTFDLKPRLVTLNDDVEHFKEMYSRCSESLSNVEQVNISLKEEGQASALDFQKCQSSLAKMSLTEDQLLKEMGQTKDLLKAATEDLEVHKETLKECRERSDSLENIVKDTQGQVERVTRAKEGLESEVTVLKIAVAELGVEKGKLEQQLISRETLSTDLETRLGDSESLVAELKTKEDELAQVRNENSGLRNTLRETLAANELLSKAELEAKADVALLDTRVRELEDKLVTSDALLNSKTDHLESELELYKSRLVESGQELNVTLSNLEKVREQYETLSRNNTSVIESLREEKSQFEEQYLGMIKQVIDLKVKLDDNAIELEFAVKELREAEAREKEKDLQIKKIDGERFLLDQGFKIQTNKCLLELRNLKEQSSYQISSLKARLRKCQQKVEDEDEDHGSLKMNSDMDPSDYLFGIIY